MGLCLVQELQLIQNRQFWEETGELELPALACLSCLQIYLGDLQWMWSWQDWLQSSLHISVLPGRQLCAPCLHLRMCSNGWGGHSSQHLGVSPSPPILHDYNEFYSCKGLKLETNHTKLCLLISNYPDPITSLLLSYAETSNPVMACRVQFVEVKADMSRVENKDLF